MNENRLRPCDICGELYPEHTLETLFTGRRVFVCRSCLKEGHKEAQGISKKFIRRKGKEERK